MAPHSLGLGADGRVLTTMDQVTVNPPTGEQEPRWQQPDFQPMQSEPQFFTPSPNQAMVPSYPAPVLPPPGTFETVVGTLARLVWPVAILLYFFTPVTFWPALVGAIIAGTVLGAVKKNLKQQRRASVRYVQQTPGSDQR